MVVIRLVVATMSTSSAAVVRVVVCKEAGFLILLF